MNLLLESARNGKIAHLSRELRDDLNFRLYKGQSLAHLRRWLNSLPEVKAMLREFFDGRPILQQNLSEWKAGGYREWLLHQELLEKKKDLVADAHSLAHTAEGLADALFGMLTLDYAQTLMKRDASEDPAEFEKKRKTLSLLTQDIVRLRRCDLNGRRVEMQSDRMDREHEKTMGQLFTLFMDWVNIPEVRKALILGPQERERRMRQNVGLPPTPEDLLVEKETAHDPAFAQKSKKQTKNKPPQAENSPPQTDPPTSAAGSPSTDSTGNTSSSPAGTTENSPAASPEGCGKLAGDNTPGEGPTIPSRPEGAPENTSGNEGETNSKPNIQNSKLAYPPGKSTDEIIAEIEARANSLSQRERDGVSGNSSKENLPSVQGAGEPNSKPKPQNWSHVWDSICEPANTPPRTFVPVNPLKYYGPCPPPGHNDFGKVQFG